MITSNQKDAWSIDNISFTYNKLSDLIDNNEMKPGDKVWVGKCLYPKNIDIFNVEDLIESMQNRAVEFCSDYSDGFMDNLNPDVVKELEQLVFGWMDKHVEAKFCLVSNSKPYILTESDFK